MMTLIADTMAIILACVSALHFYWGFGGLWPGHDPKSLAAAAIGDPRLDRLPAARLTFTVASMIAVAAAWPVAAPYLAFPRLIPLGSLLLAAVFLARGVAGYAPFFRRRHSLQPFAKLNRWFYSPLCLVLGAGFVYLAAGSMAD
jgi:hypothetical protein